VVCDLTRIAPGAAALPSTLEQTIAAGYGDALVMFHHRMELSRKSCQTGVGAGRGLADMG